MTRDNKDARHHLKAESLERAADEIMQRHAGLMARRDSLLGETHKVLHEAADIAILVETVHAELGGRRFVHWWRDQNMPPGWAEKYLRLARTRKRNAIADKDQLRLIGVLPAPETTTQGQQARAANPYAWIKWSAKISKSFPTESIKGMDETDRQMALKHLEPIAELIDSLRGATPPPSKESL